MYTIEPWMLWILTGCCVCIYTYNNNLFCHTFMSVLFFLVNCPTALAFIIANYAIVFNGCELFLCTVWRVEWSLLCWLNIVNCECVSLLGILTKTTHCIWSEITVGCWYDYGKIIVGYGPVFSSRLPWCNMITRSVALNL